MKHLPTLSVPSSAAHPTPPDGRGTDPSLLERGVTSVAHLGVARGASGRVRASPRARDRGHVSCCTSNVQQLQMLLICRLMYFRESCVRALVSEASQHPIRAEQIRGIFTLQRQSVSHRLCPELGQTTVSYCENLVIVFYGRPSLAGVLRDSGHRSGCRNFWQCVL